MHKLVLLGVALLFFACSQQLAKKDLVHLNGYWEIEKVTFPDGKSKDYTVSSVIDYIEITDLKGFRKKVQPSLEGTYSTSNDAELFRILVNRGVFVFHYKNELSEWQEQLVTLSKDRFSAMNEDGITYTYKKYEPIDVMK